MNPEARIIAFMALYRLLLPVGIMSASPSLSLEKAVAGAQTLHHFLAFAAGQTGTHPIPPPQILVCTRSH